MLDTGLLQIRSAASPFAKNPLYEVVAPHWFPLPSELPLSDGVDKATLEAIKAWGRWPQMQLVLDFERRRELYDVFFVHTMFMPQPGQLLVWNTAFGMATVVDALSEISGLIVVTSTCAI